MKELLQNPVFSALETGNNHLSFGNDQVKYFDEEVSPFVGIEDRCKNGFDALYHLLPSDRKILYASTTRISEPSGWKIRHEIQGLQFVFEERKNFKLDTSTIHPLNEKHVDEMIALAQLTKPGPFDKRTIEFGSYFGIFDNEKLVAMTGLRLHIEDFLEISAVCTHPDHLGKGYAYRLMYNQIELIQQKNKKPFLHVRADNERAISLYQRLGFKVSRPMNFYFMKKE